MSLFKAHHGFSLSCSPLLPPSFLSLESGDVEEAEDGEYRDEGGEGEEEEEEEDEVIVNVDGEEEEQFEETLGMEAISEDTAAFVDACKQHAE